MRALVALVLAAAPVAAHADWDQAMIAFDAADYDSASARFAQIIVADPDSHEAFYMMGRCYSELGKRDEAIANLDEALALDPGNAGYALALGRELLLDSQNRRAYSVLGDISADSLDGPERRGCGFLRVQAAMRSGHREEAVELAQRLVDAEPACAACHRALGAALDAAGRREEAVAELARAFELDPRDRGSAVAAVRRAASLARGSEASEERRRLFGIAAEIAERLAALQPDPENSILAGEMWLGAGEPEKALIWFERVVAAQPNDPLALYYLGSCLAEAGREDEAIARLGEALSLQPTGETLVRSHSLLGSLFAGRMELEKAARHYDAAGDETKAGEVRQLESDVGELVGRRRAIDGQLAELERIMAGLEELGETQGIGAVRRRMTALRQEQAEIDRELDRIRRALD